MAQPHYLPQGPCGWLPPQCGGGWQRELPFFPAHVCTGLMPPTVRGQRAPLPVPPPFQFLHRPPVQPPCEPPFAPLPDYYNPGRPPFMGPHCPPFAPHGRRGRGGFPSPPPFAPLDTHPFPPKGPRSYRGQKKNKFRMDGAQDVGRGQGGGAGVKEPTTGEFACTTCSKEYKSAETLQIHIEAHKKCYQCDFEAIPRVLKEHRLIHLLPDELKFSSEEEIRKWREERRKNYPTAANVAKKRKLEAEKKNRGEVARTPLHRYISHLIGECSSDRGRRGWDNKRGRGRGRGRAWPRKGRGHRNGQSRRERGSEEFLEDMSDAGSEEEINDQPESCRNSKQQPEPSLTIVPNAEEAQTSTSTKETVANGHQLEGNDMKGITEGNLLNAVMADMSKQCTQGGREKWGRLASKGRQKSLWKGPKKRQKREVIGARRPTLLEKLLAPEIRQEQNTLLQCIHHIVREDFFGTGIQAETTSASLEPELDQTGGSQPKH